MKNDSMFGTLENVLERDWYMKEENRKVILVMENGLSEYEVFLIYEEKASDEPK